MGPQCFCGVRLEWSSYCLKFSVCLDFLFPCSLARENKLILDFLSAPFGTSLLPFFPHSMSGIYEAKRRPRELSAVYSLCCEVLNCSAFYLLVFLFFSLLFFVCFVSFSYFVYTVQDYFFSKQEKQRHTCLLHFPESRNTSIF